jgi:23S rRNA (cytosine1962-C5)-methyltransferase
MSISEKHQMFKNRLLKVFKHLQKLANNQKISCFRLYDRDLPEFPLIIEKYGTNIYLAEYKSKHNLSDDEYEKWLEDCLPIISEVTGVPIDSIYLKQRQRKSSRDNQYQKLAEEKEFFVVQECGLFFKVNLSDYLDTGLFLDHRITRKMVMDQTNGKKMLNLFCYTGSFSVYAAAGGATEVVSVDLSNTYLTWAEENFRLNKFNDESKYKFVRADVKQYLDQLPADHFDIVVMDPPTFSNSKMMKDFLDIQRDHVELLNKVLSATKQGGIIYFSTNSRKFEIDSANIKASTIKDITKATTPFDFQGKLLRWCFQIIK